VLKVEANPEKNLLHITLSGHFDPQELKACADQILEHVFQLRPNFDLINDIRLLRPTDEEGVKELLKIAKALKKNGMGRCVRVVQIALSALQMNRISATAGFEPILVHTMEEAERILDSRLSQTPAVLRPPVEAMRQHRRASTGPEYSVSFSMGQTEFPGTRITNLSAQGCFAVLPSQWAGQVYEGAILVEFALNHPDLPPTRIAAKVMRLVKNLAEITEDDVGLGIMFLSPPPSFIQWVDAHVSALFAPVD